MDIDRGEIGHESHTGLPEVVGDLLGEVATRGNAHAAFEFMQRVPDHSAGRFGSFVDKTYEYEASLDSSSSSSQASSERKLKIDISEKGTSTPAEKKGSLIIRVQDDIVKGISLRGYGGRSLPPELFGWEYDMDLNPVAPSYGATEVSREIYRDAREDGNIDENRAREGEYYWEISLEYDGHGGRGVNGEPTIFGSYSDLPLGSGGKVFTKEFIPRDRRTKAIDSGGDVFAKNFTPPNRDQARQPVGAKVIEDSILGIIPKDIVWQDRLAPGDGRWEYEPLLPIESPLEYSATDIKGIWEELWRYREAHEPRVIGHGSGSLVGEILGRTRSGDFGRSIDISAQFPEHATIPLTKSLADDVVREKLQDALRQFVDPNLVVDNYPYIQEGIKRASGKILPKENGIIYKMPYAAYEESWRDEKFIYQSNPKFEFSSDAEGPADFAHALARGLDVLRVSLGVLYAANGMSLPKEHIYLGTDSKRMIAFKSDLEELGAAGLGSKALSGGEEDV